MINNFENDLNPANFPIKRLKNKPLDPKRSPLYIKLDQIETRIKSLEKLIEKSLIIQDNERVKNNIARKSNHGSDTK